MNAVVKKETGKGNKLQLIKKKRLRTALIAGVGIVALAGGAYALTDSKTVETAIVVTSALIDDFYEDGVVKASRRSIVSAGHSGKVLSVSVNTGQEVRRGDILFELDETELLNENAILEA
ncbi:biotin/lipoyl-binding protein, partial [Christensenellaceae bacterium OttesenSCG-928-M15]|nr:biotin/lipoyl-binding protein [Christensenellaceae bacterium OttesenSCG-928-M15]